MIHKSRVGETLICHETGKTFIGAAEGCTVNYATDEAGNVYSDEGVHLREEREFEAHSAPVFCYLSADGRTVTGWKGNVHGLAFTCSTRSGFGRSNVQVWATDRYGRPWYGVGAGRGMCLKLRPVKRFNPQRHPSLYDLPNGPVTICIVALAREIAAAEANVLHATATYHLDGTVTTVYTRADASQGD